MVINHKLWQDVCRPFNFPATFTSRSFTMRRLYCQLLWHFEQLYMHGASGPVQDSPFMPSANSGAVARGRGRGGVRRGRGLGRPQPQPQLQEGAGENRCEQRGFCRTGLHEVESGVTGWVRNACRVACCVARCITDAHVVTSEDAGGSCPAGGQVGGCYLALRSSPVDEPLLGVLDMAKPALCCVDWGPQERGQGVSAGAGGQEAAEGTRPPTLTLARRTASSRTTTKWRRRSRLPTTL